MFLWSPFTYYPNMIDFDVISMLFFSGLFSSTYRHYLQNMQKKNLVPAGVVRIWTVGKIKGYSTTPPHNAEMVNKDALLW
jgi:hypothetical protein